jgi:endo-1,4-beta-xylanase
MKTVLLALMLSTLLVAASPAADKKKSDEGETLRHYADQLGFRIGAGIRPVSWDQDDEGRRILAREFNTTLAMAMMGATQPQREGQFDFSKMDRTIKFAKEHDMKIWGAALIYRPDSLPEWMRDKMMRGGFKRAFGPGELDDLMKKHIQTVVRHGGDSFYAWGVVNEPLTGKHNPWQLLMGDDEYIAKAFRFAREATNAPLVLNETFGHRGIDKDRANDFFALVKRLKAQGVPIDAVGTEMHLEAQQLDPDYLDQFRDFLRRARELGVTVYITEMDVYQGPAGAVQNPWEAQKKIYHDVTATCLADSNCKGLTIWDLSDKDTWLVHRKANQISDAKPDLFDDNHEKKPAYYGVLEALKEAAAQRH